MYPDWRLWLAIHLPGSHLADMVDEQLNRTGVVVYDGRYQASVDYSRSETDHWPVDQDQARMWDTVEAAWAAWQRHDRPDRSRIGVTAVVDGPQWVWLDREDGPLQLPLGG